MSEVALVAAQVRIAVHHFDGPHTFRRLVDAVCERAAEASGDAAHRLWVFPEGIGYFLPLAFAADAVKARATVDEAFAALAVRRPLSVLRGMLDAGSPRLQRGALHAILPPADELLRSVFGAAARRHRAHVVAGSLLVARTGAGITNTSYTFDPDGRLVATTDKCNLVPFQEDAQPGGLGLRRGDPDRVPVVGTPWGSVSTLICYDGFREPHTSNERFAMVGPRVDAAGADVIANPAANNWAWEEAWAHADPGEDILRCDQWRTEGLPATLSQLRHVRYGITAHLCGRVLDQTFEGRSEILERSGGDVRVLAAARSYQDTEIVAARVNAETFSS